MSQIATVNKHVACRQRRSRSVRIGHHDQIHLSIFLQDPVRTRTHLLHKNETRHPRLGGHAKFLERVVEAKTLP